MDKIRKVIGTRLREYRKSKKYSIEELANRCGLSTAHLGKMELGKRNFTISSLDKVVTALDISYQELFNFDLRVKSTSNPYIEKTASYMETLSVEEQAHIYNTACLLAGKEKEKEKERENEF